ncbi:MAG: hypothetical protein OEZ58_22390 [Gammaproteobacteria bacterium]|nr:hypothetical protein [Gammaproteobacteria bacterium]MDH5731740.1 hypothetical protein [Gammaproteobacteria bacterium]
MNRKIFLSLVSIVAISIGTFALLFPSILIIDVKMAIPSETANVMARTVGVLLIAFGVLNYLIRGQRDSQTFRSILIANLLLQLGLVPIDVFAYFSGVFLTLGSFLPNTILHLVLAGGFVYYLKEMKTHGETE